MRKNAVNYALDSLSLLGMLALLGTGTVMKFVLPPGSGGKTLSGLGRHGWGDVHFWIAAALVAVLVLHVALHWAWVCATTRRVAGAERRPPRLRKRADLAYGVAFLALLLAGLGGFLALARSSVAAPAVPPAAEHGGERAH